MIAVRDARPEEAEALTALCLRSKASWGYDAAFMAVSRPVLTLTPERIARGAIWVAEDEVGRRVGVAAIVADGDEQELDLLFVAPEAMKTGAGRMMLAHALDAARQAGAARLIIASDVHAAGFYERCGAVRIGDVPSDAVAGRTLPLLAIALR